MSTAENTAELDMEVVIIGGGPAGLTAGLLLAELGVGARIYERRSITSRLPRAHLLNQRTMEIFEALGLADEVYAMNPPPDQWHRVGWYTSLGGERPAQGKEIGHLQAWGGGTDAERYRAASPAKFSNVPQMRLDPLLRQHAELRANVHFGHEVVAIRQGVGFVEVDIVHAGSAQTETVRARYAIAADGGRLCTDLLGVEMTGPTKLLTMVTMHVSADLSEHVVDDEVLLYYFISPEGRGNVTGSMCAMGPDTWGRHSKEWAIHQSFPWGDPAANDDELLLRRARDILGIPDLDLEVHATSRWEFEGVIADRMRRGDVFIAGNAAHRHPPTGGLGLNAAVQDAHNLAWKLALVIKGHADDALLDTYHSERHAVDSFNVDHSIRNAGGHRRVAEALGQRADQDIEDGWAELDLWLSDSPEGKRRRAEVAEAVASNADDYGQLNVELGFAYEHGALVPDGTEREYGESRLRDYVPSTRPGHHLAQVWLESATGPKATIHLVPIGGFALFTTGAAAEHWRLAAAAVEARSGVEIRVVAIGDDVTDPTGDWAAVRGTEVTGAVLVRPDWHVAARFVSLPSEPEVALAGVFDTVLGCSGVSVEVPPMNDHRGRGLHAATTNQEL